MAIGRGGNSIKTRLGFLVYGDYGTWKSSFCLESLKLKTETGRPFRVLYIDPESGGADTYINRYEEQGIDTRNVYMLYTQSLAEVKEAIQTAKEGGDFYVLDDEGNEQVYLDGDGEPFRPDMIVVDGLTILYDAKAQSIIEFSKKRATVRANKNEVVGMAKEVAVEGAGLEVKDYNTLKLDGQNLVLDLLGSGKHFIVTAREKAETEPYKDKDGSIKSARTGRMIPDGFKGTSYNCKTVLRMFKDTDGIISAEVEMKDRTLVYEQNTIIKEPSILAWQVAIDKNAGKKDFTITNNLDAAIKHEMEVTANENMKYDEDVEHDNVSEISSVSKKLETPEEYYSAIKEAISKMSSVEVKKKQTEIRGNDLPRNYLTLTDMDKLSKYFDIISR